MLKVPVTDGRKKLTRLGVNLPLFPLSLPGSLPKHPELLELRYKVNKGVQAPADLERKERVSTELWIKEQERLGFDVLVDGEMSRGDFVQHFAQRIEGFEIAGTVRSYGNRYYKRPAIKTKLQWRQHLVVDSWQLLQRMTHRPVKAILTGPYTLMDLSFDEHYASREAACRDLTAILKKEIRALADAGAKIIQIDEPALSSRPAEFSMVKDSLKEITAGIKSYIILHHCYGNLTPVWKQMNTLPVDQFALEMANSDFEYLPLFRKHRTTKDLSLGVVDSHSHEVETPAQVRERLKKLRAATPAGQLWITSDCGLKTRTVDEALGKMRAMAQVTIDARR